MSASKRALIGVILLASVLRAWAVWGPLPYIYHPDENTVVRFAVNMIRDRDPNPHYFAKPSLVFYTQSIALSAYKVTAKVLGSDFQIEEAKAKRLAGGNSRTERPDVWVFARSITILFSVGLVVLTFFVTMAISRRVVPATLAAGLAAVTPFLVESGRFVTVDTYAAFFATGAVLAALGIVRRGDTRLYVIAGALVGLAASSKYNAAVVALPVAVAHFARHGRRALGEWRLYVAGLCAIGAFVVATPFSVLNASSFLEQVPAEARHYAKGHAGAQGSSFVFYVIKLLEGVGPLVLFALAVWLHRDRRREVAVVASFGLGYLAFVGSFPAHFERNLLPVTPAILVLAALGATAVFETIGKRTGAPPAGLTKLIAIVLVLAFAAIPLVQTVKDSIRDSTDYRRAAREWIAANVNPGSRIAIESYTPWIDKTRFEVFSSGFLIDRDPAWFDRARIDFAVAAEGAYGRFFIERRQYAEKIAAYERLFGRWCRAARFVERGYEIQVFSVDCKVNAASPIGSRQPS